jgi:putative oxidoreductase
VSSALLLLHVFLGLALVAHAGQKAIVFRLDGLTAYLRGFGLRAPRLLAVAAIANELVGGILLALGLLVPLATALVVATMAVAARTDHRGKGWFITGPGVEYVTTNAVLATALAVAGAGRFSLDRAFGIGDAGLAWGVAAAAAGLAAAAVVLAVFRSAAAPSAVSATG